MRTVYGFDSRGRYIAREKKLRIGGGHCWIQTSRVYEWELLTGFPTGIDIIPTKNPVISSVG